jgi:hypothetical protein
LLQKRYVSGYGGVAVQACSINNQSVTVLYGHLKLESISAATNQTINSGDKLGILGQGYSSETDKERKHLHLSIHKGKAVNVQGYVQNQTELNAWLDPMSVLKNAD